MFGRRINLINRKIDQVVEGLSHKWERSWQVIGTNPNKIASWRALLSNSDVHHVSKCSKIRYKTLLCQTKLLNDLLYKILIIIFIND